MTPKILPTNSKVLVTLLCDCSQKLVAASEVLMRDLDRLRAFEDYLDEAIDHEILSQRLGAMADAGSELTVASGAAPSLTPYIDLDLFDKIETKRLSGVAAVKDVISSAAEGDLNVEELAKGYKEIVAANRAWVTMLSLLERRIVDASERGHADAKTDAPRKIKKPGSIQSLHLRLYVELELRKAENMSEIDIASKFVAENDAKASPESLLRGVRRLREAHEALDR